MNQGKINKKAIILCTECMSIYKSLADYKRGTDRREDIPDFLKDLLNGKVK
jgi:hypothetical protein